MDKDKVTTSAVWFELPFCLYVNDGIYEINMGHKIGAISIRRRARYDKAQDLPFCRGGFVLGIDPQHCEIKGDRFGLVAYSEIIVSMLEDFSDDIVGDTLKERAVEYLNRFIDVYRTVTQEFWIQPISVADLVAIMTKFISENGKEIPGLAFMMPRQVSSGEITIKRSDEVHQTIINMLKQDIGIPVYTRLMLDSLSNIQFGKLPISVVEAQTAFENFFYIFVRYELNRRGLLSPSLQRELEKPGFKTILKKDVTGKKGMDKLEYFSTLVTNPQRSFASGTSEYDNWHKHAYLLRNEIIHTGKDKITFQEAQNAFKAVEDAFGFFRQDWKSVTFR